MTQLLLVEDNKSRRKNILTTLEMAQYKIDTATSIQGCIKKALTSKPQLIICNADLHNKNGHTIESFIDKYPLLRNTPLLFFSDGPGKRTESVRLNDAVIRFVDHPFTSTSLLKAVEEVLTARAVNMPGKENIEPITAKMTLAEFANNREIQHVKKKHAIYMEGNHPLRLFYIQRGKVKTIKTNNEGKELTIGLYNEGEFLGYPALLEGTNYKDTAVAMEDCELSIIPKEEFGELMQTNRQAAGEFTRLLARDFSEKEEQLVGIAYNSLRKRVADALMTLQQKFFKASKTPFSMHISREDLANLAGTATESLIRTLSDFKNEKLIEIKKGNIIIRDAGRLQRL